MNNVSGPSYFLSGSLTASGAGAFTVNGLNAFSGLAAGQADTAPVVSFKTTGPGTYVETITLNSTGSNASGYAGALASETVTITVNVGQTYTLTNKATTIKGGAGNNVIVATNGTLNSGDQIDGGANGINTLSLQGGGFFDLSAPKTLADIQLIAAQEGAGANYQNIYLRSGMNATVNVTASTAKGAGITIIGANDSDTINLGSGLDTVVLGSALETVNGGLGNDNLARQSRAASAPIRWKSPAAVQLKLSTFGRQDNRQCRRRSCRQTRRSGRP